MIQPQLENKHNFTRKEKSTIFCLVLVVAILFGVSFYQIGKNTTIIQADDSEKLQLRKTADSCLVLVGLRDSSNASLKREFADFKRQDVASDSAFVVNKLAGKNERNYLAKLDSLQRVLRIDSILKGAAIRK